jgi:hypothetical protein
MSSKGSRKWLVAAGAAGLAGASYVGLKWLRYGKPRPPKDDEADSLLDRFLPAYEVAERHHIRVAAPAAITLAAAGEMDLLRSPIARAIFKARELVMGARPDDAFRPRGLLAQAKSLGWGLLAEIPERQFVFGAITRPWLADVVFRPLPPDEFAAFAEPGYAKIVWTIRADRVGPSESIARTETRVATTDAKARAKFRRYWSLASPGIVLIRRVMLGVVKTEAEHRARKAAAARRAVCA